MIFQHNLRVPVHVYSVIKFFLMIISKQISNDLVINSYLPSIHIYIIIYWYMYLRVLLHVIK